MMLLGTRTLLGAPGRTTRSKDAESARRQDVNVQSPRVLCLALDFGLQAIMKDNPICNVGHIRTRVSAITTRNP